MIITLGLIGFIIIGIILYKARFTKFSWSTREAIEFAGIMLIAIGIIGSFLTFGIIIGNMSYHDLEYQNKLHEKEMLEYRVDHITENMTGNEMLYNDIVEFNNTLRAEKKWANSPWTNWFCNQEIAAMDYVELSSQQR